MIRLFSITVCVLFLIARSETTTQRGRSSANNGSNTFNKIEEFNVWSTVLFPFAPISNRIKNEICKNQSHIFLEQLQMHKLWAIQMYDSSAKFPSGILRTNINQFGDFDQCLSINTDDTLKIEGKYCLAYMDVSAVPDSLQDTLNVIQYYGIYKSTYKTKAQLLPHVTTINWGVCVPATCSYADVHQALLDALQIYNETYGVAFDVMVKPDMCYVKSDTEKALSGPAIVTLIFFGCFIGIAVIATFLDKFSEKSVKHKQGTLKRIIMAFSISKNIHKLTDDTSPTDDKSCLYGIRCIFTIIVSVGHKFLAFTHLPLVNRQNMFKIAVNRWFFLLNSPMIMTDPFLILSAMLATHSLFKTLSSRKNINWINFYISRYIRLTPAYLAMVLFYTYLQQYLGNGPIWNRIMKRNIDCCKETWLWNIFYINNYFQFIDQCAVHTHYLPLEMQLSFLLPLVVTLLWKWKIIGAIVSFSLIVTSTILRYKTAFENQLSIARFHGIKYEQMVKFLDILYSKSQHRASAYVLGVCLGYLLYKYGKNSHISKSVIGIGWVLSGCLFYLLVYPSYMVLRGYKYDVEEQSLYAAYSPICGCLIYCWILWLCSTTNTGLIFRFFSCKIFKICSRLSYTVYLVQFPLVFWKLANIRAPLDSNVIHYMLDLPEIITIFVASVFLTLLFDLPFQEIRKIAMEGGKNYQVVHEDRNEDAKNGKDKIH